MTPHTQIYEAVQVVEDDQGLMVWATLPVYARSEPNVRGHWSQRAARAKEQRGVTHLAFVSVRHLIRAEVATGRPLAITLTRLRPAKALALDTDNLAASLKAVRDGVAETIGLDDGSERLTWTYRQDTDMGYGVSILITTMKETQ